MCGVKSHSGHSIDLHVAHRIVAVSADDFFAERGSIRKALNAPVQFRATSASASTTADDAEGAADDEDSCSSKREVKQG